MAKKQPVAAVQYGKETTAFVIYDDGSVYHWNFVDHQWEEMPPIPDTQADQSAKYQAQQESRRTKDLSEEAPGIGREVAD